MSILNLQNDLDQDERLSLCILNTCVLLAVTVNTICDKYDVTDNQQGNKVSEFDHT